MSPLISGLLTLPKYLFECGKLRIENLFQPVIFVIKNTSVLFDIPLRKKAYLFVEWIGKSLDHLKLIT